MSSKDSRHQHTALSLSIEVKPQLSSQLRVRYQVLVQLLPVILVELTENINHIISGRM